MQLSLRSPAAFLPAAFLPRRRTILWFTLWPRCRVGSHGRRGDDSGPDRAFSDAARGVHRVPPGDGRNSDELPENAREVRDVSKADFDADAADRRVWRFEELGCPSDTLSVHKLGK